MAARKKKDFGTITTDRVSNQLDKSLDTGRHQTEPTAEEIIERGNNLKTQGRKGCKAPRINLAFTPDNYALLANLNNMTEFVNDLIAAWRKSNPELVAEIARTHDRIRESFDNLAAGYPQENAQTETTGTENNEEPVTVTETPAQENNDEG